MSDFNVEDIRNIALVSHTGTGKTSIADAIMFNAKQNTRIGKVDDESSMFDYEPEEIKRKSSISASVGSFDWSEKRFNIIDTPGSSNFIADTRNCIQAADSAAIIFDAIDTPKVQSIKLIKFMEEQNTPKCIFINKLDRENANYETIIDSIKRTLNLKPVLLQIPIGSEANFRGVIDLISMKAFMYENNESGNYTEAEIPQELREFAEVQREESVESILECDDKLLESYLDGVVIDNQDIKQALKKGVLNNQIVPVLFGSAHQNIGIKTLMDFWAEFMPSPKDKGSIKALNAQRQEVFLKPESGENLSAVVFKTIADPYAGQLNLIRVFSGEMKPDSNILNSNNGSKEKITQILHLSGKNHTNGLNAIAGDIVAVAKLKDTHTGNTLCSEKYPVTIPMAEVPVTVISFAIKPKNKGEEEKIFVGLKRLMEEDQTLHVTRNEQTKEMLLSGMGQVHLDVIIEKLKRKFGVDVLLETPKIPYKETITADAKVQGKYKKQSGGKGQYGDCWIELHPINRDVEFEFVDKIVGGAIPRQYIPAVEIGIKEAMHEGVLAGYPVVGLQAVAYDGSYHPVDSSEMAFKVAGSMAFKKGAMEAKPVLLEPLMRVEITVPEEHVGDIMGDLNGRRGKMLGIESIGENQVVKAEIPMAEMLKYSADLNSMTSGSGMFTMEFTRYEEVPAHLAQKIIEDSKKVKEVA